MVLNAICMSSSILQPKQKLGLKYGNTQNILECNDNQNFMYNQSSCDFIRASIEVFVPGADEKSSYGALFA